MKTDITGKQIFKWAILVLFVLVFFETASYITGRYLGNKFSVFYNPPKEASIIKENYNLYMSQRHNVLGWPFKSWQKDQIDRAGSRIVPAFPDPDQDKSCVSLYGDSFTWASGVKPEFAWGNILSKLLECRVANYGQPAYGTDQSYMRFEINQEDEAPVVILAHLSVDILRNLTQYFELISKREKPGFSFKPRFILKNGELVPVSLQDFSEEEYIQAVLNPEKYLEHDYFISGGPSGKSELSFPYSYSLIRALIANERIPSILQMEPYSAGFYEEGHESNALQITKEIIIAFENLAHSRGKKPVVVIFPVIEDVTYYKKNGVWVYQSLIDSLKSNEIDSLNIGVGIVDYLDGKSPGEIYILEPGSLGHFNAEGNKLTAELVYNYLQANGIF